ncbi:MAG: Spy/CpxP family protein refolding chaperone [Desulforhabdus sp.]|nr:Spy/CpxP family protein refolding chaperone [Desulforhabdus sp.]
MKKLLVVITAMMLLLVSGQAFARHGKGDGKRGMDWYAAELGLTEEQKTQMQAKRDAFKTSIAPLRDELISKKQEMKQLWAVADPDEAAIMVKFREINELRTQIKEKAIQYKLERRELLTPEQKVKAAALVASSQGWKSHGSGKGGHHKGMRDWK